jgi:hypothetical protein
MNQKTIDILKIISNWILIIALLSALIVTLMYKQDVQEAIGDKEPDRLIKLYEERTNTKCLCDIHDDGSLIYIPIKV